MTDPSSCYWAGYGLGRSRVVRALARAVRLAGYFVSGVKAAL